MKMLEEEERRLVEKLQETMQQEQKAQIELQSVQGTTPKLHN
jgi:hypothetical protein